MAHLSHKLKFNIIFLVTAFFCLGPLHSHLSAQDAQLDTPHDNAIDFTGGCLHCHQMTAYDQPNMIPPNGNTPQDIDDSLYNNVCLGCHDGVTALNAHFHSSNATSSKYGTWTVECIVCHNQHSQEQNRAFGTTYGKFIRRNIDLSQILDNAPPTGVTVAGKSGKRAVKFIAPTGPNSFADGDTTIDGICEVCHTQTSHFRNDGSLSGVGVHTGLKGSNCLQQCHLSSQGPEPTYRCLDCHDDPTNPETNISRSSVNEQFNGNSHHVQRADGSIKNTDCYQCHWEADIDGRVTSYHGSTPSSVVDLVIYGGSGVNARPTTYAGNVLQYTADGSRSQIVSLNSHCLSCHDDDTKGEDIFGDGKKPDQYAWDNNSIDARYSQTGTTTWGKYTSGANTAEKNVTKAYSAHGNAQSNFGGGWSTTPSCEGTYVTQATCPDLGGSWNATTLRCDDISLESCIQNYCTNLTEAECNAVFGVWGASSSICKNTSQDTCRYGYCDMGEWDGGVDKDFCLTRGGIYKYNHTIGTIICRNITSSQCSSSGNAWVVTGGTWRTGTSNTYRGGIDHALDPTRGGGSAVNVACFDCHNSHGSSVVGTTTSYISTTTNGGILKDVSNNQGGYTVSYKPVAGGSVDNKNEHNAGAALCFDCHLTGDAKDDPDTKPWSYDTTFGATQPIIGYFDSAFLAPGQTGSQQRYPYKGRVKNAGGHFNASSELKGLNEVHDGNEALHQINGLCTPCHDPHGVSPTLLQQYSVPLLKGTWVTSPYREDVSPANNAVGTIRDGTYPLGNDERKREGAPYNIDQNSFGANIRSSVTGVTQTDSQFAGLCLNCHPKANLTDGNAGGTWKSVDRIHESVKGWGANAKHKYTCSKCHTPHNGSALPRLMVTNCLDTKHKGRSPSNPVPVLQGSGYCDADIACYGQASSIGFSYMVDYVYGASGGGRFPGSWSGYVPGSYAVNCHEGETGAALDQSWNDVTPWIDETPTITSGPYAIFGGQVVLYHMDETSWDGTTGEVQDSSGLGNHGTAVNATIAAGGIGGSNSGYFSGTAYIPITYNSNTLPMNNFTMEAWIKPGATANHEIDPETTSGTYGTSGQRYLFYPDYRGTSSGAGISAGTNGISVYEHGGGYMPALAVYSASISSSTWTHVAVVYENKRPSIYINGTLVHTGLQSPKANVYAPTKIGGVSGGYGFFRGHVDEVAVYDKALTAGEVFDHYRRTSSVTCNTPPDIKWTTDFNAKSYVDYGLTDSYGSSSGTDTLVTTHKVPLSGLTYNPSTTYHYQARTFNDYGETLSSDKTFETQTCPSLPPIVTSPAGTEVDGTTWTLGATVFTDSGWNITAWGTTWGTSPNPSGNVLEVAGTATGAFSHVRSGLPAGSKIYYRGYATNAGGTDYSEDGSFYTEPVTQASIDSITPSGTEMTVNWTRGSGDGVIVLMKLASGVDSDPVDGIYNEYLADTKFGSGTQIGNNNYVVYKGTGTGVTVTDLSLGATYHVKIYEYTATVSTSGVNQGTNYRQHDAPVDNGSTIIASGPHTYTFDYTGFPQVLYIPPTATSIQFTLAGGGGGGGRFADYGDQGPGQNGDKVVTSSTAADTILSIYVAGGGLKAIEDYVNDSGAPGGWGNPSGQPGEDGDNSFGGAGGGGASSIYDGTTRLAEAKGGNGGQSDSWDFGGDGGTGGAGGTGGGTNVPDVDKIIGAGGGGGADGSSPLDGDNGHIVITFTIP